MRNSRRRVGVLVVLSMLALGCVACAPVMQLKPEERAMLHVGQRVTLQMPASYGGLGGGAGDALRLVQKKVGRDRIVYLYRAVQPGNQVFLAVSEKRECVSCVTVHWFVTVSQ